MNLCEYGCGQEAKFQFKSGKWCCESHWSKCSKIRINRGQHLLGKKLSAEHKRKLSESHKGIKYPPKSEDLKIKIGLRHKGKIVSEETRKKLSISNTGKRLSSETKQKMSISRKGREGYWKNKIQPEEYRRKQSIALRYSIEDIQNKYPLFSMEEEMRYDPNKPDEKEIQFHCKNSNCINSKEKGGWFTPPRDKISVRISQVESNKGWNGLYFYCSDKCKKECHLYHLHKDPLRETKSNVSYNDAEYQTWRKEVLSRQFKELGYNECEKCGATENLHIHHERPQKTNSILSLDPDNGIILCEECHYTYGHSGECGTGQLANKLCA